MMIVLIVFRIVMVNKEYKCIAIDGHKMVNVFVMLNADPKIDCLNMNDSIGI